MKQPPSKVQRCTLRRCALALALLVVSLVLSMEIMFTPTAVLHRTEREHALSETEILNKQSLGNGKLLLLSANESAVILSYMERRFPQGWDSTTSVLDYLPVQTCCIGTMEITYEKEKESTLYVYGRLDAEAADGMHISVEAYQMADEAGNLLPVSEWGAPFLYREADLRKGDLFYNNGYFCFYAAIPIETQYAVTRSFDVTATPMHGDENAGAAVKPHTSSFLTL